MEMSSHTESKNTQIVDESPTMCTCYNCNGTGKLGLKECPDCIGKGVVNKLFDC